MTSVAVRQHRKARKVRRTGKHAAPSHAEVVAQRAGKAIPAVVLVGALTAAVEMPASSNPARSAVITHPDIRARRNIQARPGTLASWGVRASLHTPAWLARLAGADRSARAARPQPAAQPHASPPQPSSAPHPPVAGRSAAPSSQPVPGGALQGTLGCSGLEALWRSAGGSPSHEVTAASVAMAESTGNQYATGPFGERGYWQINPDHGVLSTYDAYGNARAAIIISGDGTNWSAWTTYIDGAYLDRC